MRYDLSPLYRSTVGFERLADMLERAGEPAQSWPPYNVLRTGEDAYRVVMALPGFASDELDVVQQENALLVTGKKDAAPDDGEVLHRGIMAGTFRKTFELAEHVKVKGATFDGGLLTIELQREIPEALRPKRIEIRAGTASAPQIEHSKAA